MAYLDDIIIYSETIEEHLAHIKDVLDRLAKAGLTVHPEKLLLCVTEITSLGHVLAPGVMRPDPDKVRAVVDFPTPRNVKQVQQFLGLAGYYQGLVPSFSMVAKPLHQLLRKDSEWHWGEPQEVAVQELKRLLLDMPGVALPDLNKEFTIQTDASGVGLGAVPLQDRDGLLTPVAFVSRGLTKAEANYSVPQLECLAVVWAINKYAQYIEYMHFTIQIDHQALKWLQMLKEPTGRLVRWSLFEGSCAQSIVL